MKKVLVLLAMMMPALLFAQSWKSKTLITIGDKKISAKEFMDVYEKNNLKNDIIDQKDIDEYLEMYINFKLKVAEAESLKMDTLPKFIKEFDGYRNQLAKPYFSNDEITEQLIEEAYERLHWDINASHILVKCDVNAVPADTLKAYNRAMELRNRIIGGEDFHDVAEQASNDPSARDTVVNKRQYIGNRGYLGYFTAFQMVYPFETAAYNATVGEVTMPVRTDYGYHLLLVNSKTPACGIITAAHIYLAVNDKDPLKNDSVVKEKAYNIYKQIDKDGKNWDAMVRKYSEDNGTKSMGGMLSPFKVNAYDPSFVDAIKQLENGGISEPVKSFMGYHIVRLISTKGVGTLDQERENIKKRVERDSRAKLSEEIVMKRIMKENHFVEYTKQKDAFIATIDTSLKTGKYVMAKGVNPKKALFKFDNKKYTIGDFAKYLEEKGTAQPFMSTAAYAYKMYEEFLQASTFAYEDSHLEQKYPDFKMLVTEYHDGLLLFDLMDKEVWKKAEKDTAGLRSYYEDHKNDYMWGERVKTLYATVPNPDNVSVVESLINEENITLDSIRSFIKQNDLRGVTVKALLFQHGDNADIDSIPWEPGKAIVIPSTVDKSTKIVRVTELREPQPKSLREARGLVTSAYQTELENQWLSVLREKYKPHCDAKLLLKVKESYTQEQQ